VQNFQVTSKEFNIPYRDLYLTRYTYNKLTVIAIVIELYDEKSVENEREFMSSIPWLYSPLRILASFTTDAHSPFC
jgi:hypothetical protein